MDESNTSKIDWSRLRDQLPDPEGCSREDALAEKYDWSLNETQEESVVVNEDNTSKIDWTYLLDKLPDPVWRHRWDDLAAKHGLPFKRSYLQNLDSEHRGPEKKYLKNRVAYPLPSLITWLNSL